MTFLSVCFFVRIVSWDRLLSPIAILMQDCFFVKISKKLQAFVKTIEEGGGGGMKNLIMHFFSSCQIRTLLLINIKI